jgi:hypothetical protein
MSDLGLDTANRSQSFEPIPAGTVVELVMQLKPGNMGIEGLCAQSSKGDCAGINVEYTVQNGEHEGRKLHAFHILTGTTVGHGKARDYTLALLRAILEAINGIDPKDDSPATVARRASATLSGFNGATFLAELRIERGGLKPDGSAWPDKNVISRVLRTGDAGYRKLEQPAPSATLHRLNGAPAVVVKPNWAS